jgi:uncharacterized damage-inducible protein DinB
MDLADQVLGTWRVHQEILLFLLDSIPAEGMAALPANSRGRNVALQFGHLDAVRRGWLQYLATGKEPKMPRQDKAEPPAKAQLKTMLTDSGEAVADFLDKAIRGETKTRMFDKHAVRFMGYLIAHESHHRGQIMLALKQSGIKMPAKVAMDGMWGAWFRGGR